MLKKIISFVAIATMYISGCAVDTASTPESAKTGSISTVKIDFDPKAEIPFKIVSDFNVKLAVQLTSNASWSGPGVWDETTHHLSAHMCITSLDATYNWNEPSVVVTAIYRHSPSDVIQFQQVNAGTFTSVGGGTEGSSYALADIEKSSSAYNVACQQVTIYDPTDVSFSLQMDLYATQTTGAVDADHDHDDWNSEAGPAGDDCDDNDPTKYPGGGTCTCGTTTSTCTNCAATNNCCSVSSIADCGSGCNCSESVSSAGSATCAANSVCNFTVTGNNNKSVSISSCDAGANCNMTCSGNNTSCNIGTCSNAVCNITMAPGKSRGAGIVSCAAGSSCTIACAEGSTCTMNCTDPSSKCVITGCGTSGLTGAVGGTCNLTCSNGRITMCSGGVNPPYYTCGSC